jgi:hypothetical protein
MAWKSRLSASPEASPAASALVQGGRERGLPGVLEPAGVGGQRGGLGQRGQPGEQRRAPTRRDHPAETARKAQVTAAEVK